VRPDEAVRPPVLQTGDMVAVASPAGPASPDLVASGIALLRSWGLRPVPTSHAFDQRGYLAGSDTDRASDLNEAFANPEIRAVVMTRGGYGCQRIVDRIDMAAVARDPKPVVGFSDVTALQLALWRGARLAGVHGPGAAWRQERTGAESAQSLQNALMTTEPVVLKQDPGATTALVSRLGATGLPGTVTGPLLGGNLTLLATSLGTADFPDLTGAVLLLEDVDEAPYRVDRMLTQLRRSGVLAALAGVAVGQFTRCHDQSAVAQTTPTDVTEVLADRLGDLGIPVLGGLPIGHGNDQLTVPVGVPATLDVPALTLTVAPAVR
jgi:muramoyltetrapeptide carboxypeptidase